MRSAEEPQQAKPSLMISCWDGLIMKGDKASQRIQISPRSRGRVGPFVSLNHRKETDCALEGFCLKTQNKVGCTKQINFWGNWLCCNICMECTLCLFF